MFFSRMSHVKDMKGRCVRVNGGNNKFGLTKYEIY